MTDSRKTQTLRHYSTTCYICGGKGVLPRDHNILSRRPGEPMLSSGIQKGQKMPSSQCRRMARDWRAIRTVHHIYRFPYCGIIGEGAGEFD